MLRALDRSHGRFINVLFWQLEQTIDRALVVFKVTATVWIEDSSIHHLGETDAFAFAYLLDTAGVALLSWLFRNGPVVFLGTSHANSGRQHVFLVDGEGIDIDYLVLEILKTGFFVRAFGPNGQTEKSGDSTTYLVRVSRLTGKGTTIAGVLVATLK